MTHTLGFIGLGRMGQQIVEHLLEQHVDVVGYNRTQKVTETFASQHTGSQFSPVFSIADFIAKLPSPRVIWLMVPNGNPIDEVIAELRQGGLSAGDTVIDGGNCYYKDSMRRAEELAKDGIHFIDCGTSGGLEGARHGACCMIGGDASVVQTVSWVWDAVAVSGGWRHFGPSGAGHFVKMVHNGVEYGMNQAIAEGFAILEKSPFQLDLHHVAETWNHGSVVRGWLMELLAAELSDDPKLQAYDGTIGGGSTGKWTLEAGKELDVPTPVMMASVEVRDASQALPHFGGKVVSALRHAYGGHKEGRKES